MNLQRLNQILIGKGGLTKDQRVRSMRNDGQWWRCGEIIPWRAEERLYCRSMNSSCPTCLERRGNE